MVLVGSVGQICLDLGNLDQLTIQLALQWEHLTQTWLITRQPGLRIDDTAVMFIEIGFHPVQRVFQPGNQSDRRGLAVDVDRLRKIRPIQRQARFQPCVAPTGVNIAGEVKAADIADDPAALAAFPCGKTDFRQQRRAGGLALYDRLCFHRHGEQIATGRSSDGKVGSDGDNPPLRACLILLGIARSPDSAASMNRALRSLFCHIVASIEPSVA